VDEAQTGLKSSLAVKIFGSNLTVLDSKAEQVKNLLSKVRGITGITVVRELGQPSLIIEPDRAKIARYGLNVSDINTLIETAIGGTAATQVIQGERQFDLEVRMQEKYRSNVDSIKSLLIATPDGSYLPLSQLPVSRLKAVHRSFIASRTHAMSGSSSVSRAATLRARLAKPAKRREGRAAPDGLYMGLGRRVQRLSGFDRSDEVILRRRLG